MPVRKPGLLNRLLVILALAGSGGSLNFNTIQKKSNLEFHTLTRVLHSLRSDKILEKEAGRKGQWCLKPGWVEYGYVLYKKLLHKKLNPTMLNMKIKKEIESHSVEFGLPEQLAFEQVKKLSSGAYLREIKKYYEQYPELLRLTNYRSITEVNTALMRLEPNKPCAPQVWKDYYLTGPNGEILEDDSNAKTRLSRNNL